MKNNCSQSSLFFMAIVLVAFVPQVHGQSRIVGLCNVSKLESGQNQPLITVHAQYITDGFEGRSLVDLRCPDSGLGLIFGSPQGLRSKRLLEKALRGRGIGTANVSVFGDFSGTIELRALRKYLLVEHISHLKVLNKGSPVMR